MDKIEYQLLSPTAVQEIAKQRIGLAILGDAERLARAYSDCPWLIDGDCLDNARGKAYPSLLATLCSYASAQACRKFGALITPTDASSDRFEALVEAMSIKDRKHLFTDKGEKMAGSRFCSFHQGLDDNPNFASGFGSRLYASIGSLHHVHMLDGFINPADAAWWLQACQGAARGKPIEERTCSSMATMQIGESFALLAEALRKTRQEDAQEAIILGTRVGQAMALLSQDWSIDDPKDLFDARTVELYKTATSWRCKLASIARRVDGPHVQAGIDAAISQLGEPLLACLASGLDHSDEDSQPFLASLDARRIQLASQSSSTSGKTMRI